MKIFILAATFSLLGVLGLIYLPQDDGAAQLSLMTKSIVSTNAPLSSLGTSVRDVRRRATANVATTDVPTVPVANSNVESTPLTLHQAIVAGNSQVVSQRVLDTPDMGVESNQWSIGTKFSLSFLLMGVALGLFGALQKLYHPSGPEMQPLAMFALDTEDTRNRPTEFFEDGKFNGRSFRRSLNQSDKYTRKAKNDADSIAQMESDGVGYSKAGLVAKMREQGFVHTEGDVILKLAEAYGFCWGVERAVQMAYEAKRAFPDRRLFITNEIIHNPEVNGKLENLGFTIMDQHKKDFSVLEEGDVAVLPAFGASVDEMNTLINKGVQIVDTTCPWVSKVWTAVDGNVKSGFTSIVHGKWAHEETVATVSFAHNYLVVKDMTQAEYVVDYILNGGDKQEFYDYFTLNAMSKGFDPEVMLEKVGLANQTTMLRSETQAIGKLLEKTMMQKYGPQNLSDHYEVMDTICDATQERQDGIYGLLADQTLDFCLVVGGFNSSNTSHLQEICEEKGVPGFWVDSSACVDVENNTIRHRMSNGEMKTTTNWIPSGVAKIGMTSGASTPDKALEDVVDKIMSIKSKMS